MLKGIRKRWIINSVSLVLMVVLMAVIAFSAALSNYYYTNVSSGLRAKAKTSSDFFGSYVLNPDEYDSLAKRYTETFEEKNILELQFISTSGRILASSFGLAAGTTPNTEDIAQAIETRQISIWSGKDPSTGERIMAVSSPMIYSGDYVIGVLRYVTSLQLVDRQILIGVLSASAIGAIILLFVVLMNLYFISTIVEPVEEITNTAKRIASGSYGVQIEKKFDDEIGELADTINEMSLQISQSEKMQSEFISSVSHELRTPLTAITGWSETLLSDGGRMDTSEMVRGIGTVLKESRRLTKLVEDLLEFTKIQDDRIKLNITFTDIQAEFEETVFMYESQLITQGMSLDYTDGGEIPEIPCDGARMKQVFLNILDNAAKHGREGKAISAYIGTEEGFVVVKIRDYGPGIPEDELPHIKLKFYKGTSKERGSGIGLAVSDEIVKMHDGRLIIENAENGGTLVTIMLPVSQAQ